MEKLQSFEQALIQIVAELVEQRGFNHSTFGRYVFGEKSGARLWRVARLEERSRNITVNESLRMADFFREEYIPFMRAIYQEAKSRGFL